MALTEVLYISYDGMTDPLGQSQVIPYLIKLSEKGFHFHLISFEKRDAFNQQGDHITELLKKHHIVWHPLSYTKRPPVLSTLFDLYRMQTAAAAIIRKENITLLHCRSYLSALVGMRMKRLKKTGFLFDMRGFWADERVDGGIWKLSNPLYRSIFNFFKRKEKEMLLAADAIVTLTENARNIIQQWRLNGDTSLPITVIPCCADLNHFNRSRVQPETLNALRAQLNLHSKKPVISYLGAIGTWYMLDEMLQFFKKLLKKYPDAVFLFITHEPAATVLSKAGQQGIAPDHIRVYSAQRSEVPAALMLSDVSLFFIVPTFSKKASSPTKQGEIMGMGIPLICNSGVGDTDFVVHKFLSGMVIDLSKENALDEAVNHFSDLEKLSPDRIVQGAEAFFSLTKGVEKYLQIYQRLK